MVGSSANARDNALSGGRFIGNHLDVTPDTLPVFVRSPPQITATQSISTSNGPGQDGTCRKIRAGALILPP
jgi:hypothetical protein